MILSSPELSRYVHGALFCTEEDGGCLFRRFTDRQREYYDRVRPDFHFKTLADSSVRIEFETDASSVSFDALAHTASSRRYCYIDASCDGVLLYHEGKILQNEDEMLTVRFGLPAGTHRICIYLPNLAFLKIRSIRLENASFLRPVAKAKNILCLGDSITQGYDALFPSLSYANLLADSMDANLINQAIGGEVFRAGMLEDLKQSFDFITVAYGTNDWTHSRTKDEFEKPAEEFFKTLKSLYPKTKIFYLSPIWRKVGPDDAVETKPYPVFEQAVRILETIAVQSAGAEVIHGFSLTPHIASFYSDGYLHPNDLGFSIYAKNLAKTIQKSI